MLSLHSIFLRFRTTLLVITDQHANKNENEKQKTYNYREQYHSTAILLIPLRHKIPVYKVAYIHSNR